MSRTLFYKNSFLSLGIFGLIACSGSGNLGSESSQNTTQSSFSEAPYNFRLSLVDAPKDDIKAVYVNVDHAEILLEKGGKEARVRTAVNLGIIDLFQLRNGVMLPLLDANIPSGVLVKQIRLILKSTGNSLTKIDDSSCELKTPSAQHTGIKLILNKPVSFESGYTYSIVVDFDAEKSVVLQGNGGCLLKPVLKLKSAERILAQESPGSGQDDTPEDLTDGTENANTDDGGGSGFDTGINTDPTPVIDPGQIFQM